MTSDADHGLSNYKAGVCLGVDANGQCANFIETEQVVEFDKDGKLQNRAITSFLQTRGSIPLYWSQKPNLKWQPFPTMKPTDDQLNAYRTHMKEHRQW